MPGLLKRPRGQLQGADEQLPQAGGHQGPMPGGAQLDQDGQPMPDQGQHLASHEAMAGASQPVPGQPDPGMADDDDLNVDENNPAYAAAVEQIKRALYEQGAADSVNQALMGSPDPVEDVANLAYEMTVAADKQTQGQVPDEMIVMLASEALSEIVEIAQASGIGMQPADIASAFKMMTLRWLGENGMDTTELHEAMNQVSPEQFNQVAAEVM